MLEKRLEEIYKVIENKQNVRVSQLAKQFDVTPKTIRIDLTRLEESGMIKRVHGGAVIAGSYNKIHSMLIKKNQNINEKKRIALKAYEHIKEGDTIYLDSGSTIFELAKLIDKQVTVITNDPYIAWELTENEHVVLYVVGGRLKRVGQHSAYHASIYCGSEAIKMIKSFTIQKMFVSSSAFNFEQGLMVFSAEDAEVKRAVLSSSKQIYGLIDYSKFNRSALCSFLAADEINEIITDSRITENEIREAEKEGIRIVVA